MKKKAVKKYILIVVLAFVVFTGVYIGIHIHRNNVENRAREAAIQMEREEMRTQLNYALRMFFNHNFTPHYTFTASAGNPFLLSNIRDRFVGGEETPDWVGGPINLNEIVFVSSEEEAQGFAEDVFVAWPTEWSELFLELINDWLDPNSEEWSQSEDRAIDISDLNIELPLTRTSLVDDWELILEITERINVGNMQRIRSRAERRVGEALRRGNVIVDTDEPTEDTD